MKVRREIEKSLPGLRDIDVDLELEETYESDSDSSGSDDDGGGNHGDVPKKNSAVNDAHRRGRGETNTLGGVMDDNGQSPRSLDQGGSIGR